MIDHSFALKCHKLTWKIFVFIISIVVLTDEFKMGQSVGHRPSACSYAHLSLWSEVARYNLKKFSFNWLQTLHVWLPGEYYKMNWFSTRNHFSGPPWGSKMCQIWGFQMLSLFFFLSIDFQACKCAYFVGIQKWLDFWPLGLIFGSMLGNNYKINWCTCLIGWCLSLILGQSVGTLLTFMPCLYRKVSNISRTLVGNKVVDHSDVVGALPVGAAPTTSSFST